MDVASLVGKDSNGLSYPTPSSASTTARPSLNLPPQDTSEPAPTSTMVNGRIYSLDIVQQPVRARMCGFGDKDRRPITPPPCIRLVVTDASTNKEIDINEIDTAYLVLTVDLWSADAQKEFNLVRHSATSPSISAATASSYPPAPDAVYTPSSLEQAAAIAIAYTQPPPPPPASAYQQTSSQYHQHHYPQQGQTSHPPPPPPPASGQQQQGYYNTPTATPVTPTGYQSQLQPNQGPLLSPSQLSVPSSDPRSQASGMFTRNLIGSLCVSAFKLTNPNNEMGVWFILQDLSVRTEGSFRLKMNFVNVGSPVMGTTLNTASAPVLASCFSDKFDVYSAKKFPGVIESTNLSKCFATQGIKIPIRKDGLRGNERRPGDGEDDE
ncbi:hypothetical protein IMSHALPRED_010174 [Imshaugia aleurites]|uniref:Velvet domain-containing protein n=1 Tax=Imshaugia aleurites TaxID=172621 RepID=A0A8H3IZI5_9LECA|nr:hypothetical protein IMSHALPRED_010174 [Imshaugia aleurites]